MRRLRPREARETPFVSWLSIGVPTHLAAQTPAARGERDAVTIVHAPSAPEAKGTPIIEAAIARLRARGHAIEFVKLVGRTNADVLEALNDAAFAVDELYSDVALARFGSEAAAAGIPTITGMYGYDELVRYTEKGHIPPAHVCHPDGVERAMEELIEDPSRRRELGEQARKYVLEEWSPREVAKRFARLLEDRIPREWLFDPKDIDYVHGGGIHEDRLREVFSTVISKKGKAALQFSDKPKLLDKITALLDRRDTANRSRVVSHATGE